MALQLHGGVPALRARSLFLIGVFAVGTLLVGCVSEEGSKVEAGESSGVHGTEESKSDTKGTPEGEISIDGETFEIVDGICARVAVEDNEWRVLADFEDGDAQFDAPSAGSVRLEDGREYSISPSDDGPNISVTADGVTGEETAYFSETGDYVPFVADISCVY